MNKNFRISLGLTEEDLRLLDAATQTEYQGAAVAYCLSMNRARRRLLLIALRTICTAIVRQKLKFPYACDLRQETQDEYDERCGNVTSATAQKKLNVAVAWQMPKRN